MILQAYIAIHPGESGTQHDHIGKGNHFAGITVNVVAGGIGANVRFLLLIIGEIGSAGGVDVVVLLIAAVQEANVGRLRAAGKGLVGEQEGPLLKGYAIRHQGIMNLLDMAGQVMGLGMRIDTVAKLAAQQIEIAAGGLHLPFAHQIIRVHLDFAQLGAACMDKGGIPGHGDRDHAGAGGTHTAGCLGILVGKKGQQLGRARAGVGNLEQNVRLAQAPVGMGFFRVIHHHQDGGISFARRGQTRGGADAADDLVVGILAFHLHRGLGGSLNRGQLVIRHGGNAGAYQHQRHEHGHEAFQHRLFLSFFLHVARPARPVGFIVS